MSSVLLPANPGRVLLGVARASISSAFGYEYQADDKAPWLQEKGACFVTLTQNQELRGCIGMLEAHRTLLQDVKANALSAALRDPRFSPLQVDELDKTSIEISLLSPLQALRFSSEQEAWAQLQPGVHGVVFEFAHHHSTFLPQVWEQLPNVAKFMANLKYKAGLPSDFWADEVKLSYYTVTKWKESVHSEPVDTAREGE